MFTSCGMFETGNRNLYYWGGSRNGVTLYEALTYRDYKKQSPQAICELVCAYEDMVKHPGELRQVPPPGICAEYGYFLLKPETAEYFSEYATKSQRRYFDCTDYAAYFSERGKELLLLEIEYYPESATFLAPLIKILAR